MCRIADRSVCHPACPQVDPKRPLRWSDLATWIAISFDFVASAYEVHQRKLRDNAARIHGAVGWSALDTAELGQ